jgi:hypothetical protein
MAGKNRIVVGILVGMVTAHLAAVGIVALFRGFAAETNAIIIEEYRTSPSLLQEAAALQKLHWRIASEGGLRGFLAKKILANGGIGYPEVKEAATRVWVLTALTGAVIGMVAGIKKELAIPIIAVAALWGVATQQSPVAATTILLGGAVGGGIALAILVGVDHLSAAAEGGE